MHRENLVIEEDLTLEDNKYAKEIGNIIVQLKNKYSDTKIRSETVYIVVKDIIELIENFIISGNDKKKITIKILKELVDDLVDEENEKKLIYDIIDKKILEQTIDLIVMASKGEIKINKKDTKKKLINCGKTLGIILIKYIVNLCTNIKNKKNKKNVVVEKVTKNDIENVENKIKELKENK